MAHQKTIYLTNFTNNIWFYLLWPLGLVFWRAATVIRPHDALKNPCIPFTRRVWSWLLPGYVLLCTTMYYCVLPCISMYYYVLLRITMYFYVSLCITMYTYLVYIAVYSCALLRCTRYVLLCCYVLLCTSAWCAYCSLECNAMIHQSSRPGVIVQRTKHGNTEDQSVHIRSQDEPKSYCTFPPPLCSYITFICRRYHLPGILIGTERFFLF